MMDPRQLFLDDRLRGSCVFCGGRPDSKDHVPSKVLLDEPLPLQLPVVDACATCNTGFSLDEQYVACLIACVIQGTTDPNELLAPKVSRILTETPGLRDRITSSMHIGPAAEPVWEPEADRVGRIITKLARGHAAYELYPCLEEPKEVAVVPLALLAEDRKSQFEGLATERSTAAAWPELGTRAFHRACGKHPDRLERADGWISVQPRRYRYCVREASGVWVWIVLSEYLACRIAWA